jgi:hypothetical protein
MRQLPRLAANRGNRPNAVDRLQYRKFLLTCFCRVHHHSSRICIAVKLMQYPRYANA